MPRSAIIWTRSRELSLNVRYHRTHRTIISWSKCRPLKSSCAEAGSVIQAVTAGSRAFQVCTRTDSGRSTLIEQVRVRLAELWSYLTANQTRLINYGREYREGQRISTARVESTVDQLVDWRTEKKQHMRWTKRGAQMLLHARCALLNGELGKYSGWSPLESSPVQAVQATQGDLSWLVSGLPPQR